MHKYTTSQIIDGIRRRNSAVIDHVYASCYPEIRRLILMNRGNEHDARDLFQEAMLVVFQKIMEQGLELTVKFNTYLYSVCRFLWLQELEKRTRKSTDHRSIEDVRSENETDDRKAEAEQKIYVKHFAELSSECQKVLNMYFRKASMEEIAVVMGYKNVQIAKDKKYRCKKSLMNKIQNNPEFKLLQDDVYLAG
jgi:RNA polymerase sigma factor (sigma-70 family)